MTRTVEIVEGMASIDASAWDALTGDMPLLRHAFLSALETSQAVGKGTGWQPYPLIVKEDGEVIAAMPLYVKSHSYGEYVFDWAWAEAYQRSGFNYYPKLLSAIPFTPITSTRMLIKAGQNADEIRALMLSALVKTATHHHLSSIHINFPDSVCEKALSQTAWMRRTGVQFRWENQQFADFDAFLATLSMISAKKLSKNEKKPSHKMLFAGQLKAQILLKLIGTFFINATPIRILSIALRRICHLHFFI